MRAKGHGRNGANAYSGAEKIEVPHETLKPGDPCPECIQGTVYETMRPGVLVRISGQAPLLAKVYELQKLRCNPCGMVFTARPPAGVGSEKYDATAGGMIGLLKYGTGMPFSRMERTQGHLGIPLPASTQWDIVSAHAKRIKPAHEELIRQAAGGDIVFNDDTGVKILELMGKRAEQQALAEGPVAGGAEAKVEKRRTGLFTSGIVSTREGHRIALFFSGRKHAGENLKDVLLQRAADLAPPIQMGRAALIGDQTGQWAAEMVQRRGVQGVRVLMGLVNLAEKHSYAAIERACETARSYQAYRLRTVRQLAQRDAAKQREFEFMDEHPIIRSLTDYGELVERAFRKEVLP